MLEFKGLSIMSACTQLTITCSKATIETLEQGVNMVKVNNKSTRTTPLTSFWCFYFLLSTYFTPFSSVYIVDFEQVNVVLSARNLFHLNL